MCWIILCIGCCGSLSLSLREQFLTWSIMYTNKFKWLLLAAKSSFLLGQIGRTDQYLPVPQTRGWLYSDMHVHPLSGAIIKQYWQIKCHGWKFWQLSPPKAVLFRGFCSHTELCAIKYWENKQCVNQPRKPCGTGPQQSFPSALFPFQGIGEGLEWWYHKELCSPHIRMWSSHFCKAPQTVKLRMGEEEAILGLNTKNLCPYSFFKCLFPIGR